MKTRIAAGVVATLMVLADAQGGLVYTVVNSHDSGSGSLRQAILDANSNAGLDTIAFAAPAGGLLSIKPESPLPDITDPVIIDGYTQAGASPNTLAEGDNAVLMVELNGELAGPQAWGLRVLSGQSTVRGLVINGFSYGGIRLEEKSGNTVVGNFIGTDVSGASAVPNGYAPPYQESGAGVDIYTPNTADGNRIGGTRAEDRNLISGNSMGIHIQPGYGNLIQGNYIGTDATGTQPLPNTGLAGIHINNSGCPVEQPKNVIGGCEPGSGNLISGHWKPDSQGWWDDGFGINSFSPNGVIVQGNRIGTDCTGRKPLPNGSGVYVGHYPGVGYGSTIGGVTLGAGNLVSANEHNGVHVWGSDHVVQGNMIGTDADGVIALGNGECGVVAELTEDCLIGGVEPGARNLISANRFSGISVSGGGSMRNLVQGNFVGTDITGSRKLGDQYYGLFLSQSLENVVGGAAEGAGNVISGHVFGIRTVVAADNRIQGNLIGTDVSGTIAIPNYEGIYMNDTSVNNLIGGTEAGARNVISGNTDGGVWILGDSSGNKVQGNYIGTDVTGTLPLGNGEAVAFSEGTTGNVVGGREPGAGNVIAYSSLSGVGFPAYAASAMRNTVAGNSIYCNFGLGIDLGDDGVTGNDPGDADVGPNANQNYPEITGVAATSHGVVIEGTLNSTPNTTFTMDFYSNAVRDCASTEQGERYLGWANATTDASGDVAFSITLPVAVPPGELVTATATDPDGNTSEFSIPSEPVVGDTTPPTISGVSVTPAVLWPPDHRLVMIAVDSVVVDDGGEVAVSLSGTSNEPDNGLGDGDTANDIQLIPGDAHRLYLRAERSGGGTGRVYTITVKATDASGNTSVKTTTVTVPHDQGNGKP